MHITRAKNVTIYMHMHMHMLIAYKEATTSGGWGTCGSIDYRWSYVCFTFYILPIHTLFCLEKYQGTFLLQSCKQFVVLKSRYGLFLSPSIWFT